MDKLVLIKTLLAFTSFAIIVFAFMAFLGPLFPGGCTIERIVTNFQNPDDVGIEIDTDPCSPRGFPIKNTKGSFNVYGIEGDVDIGDGVMQHIKYCLSPFIKNSNSFSTFEMFARYELSEKDTIPFEIKKEDITDCDPLLMANGNSYYVPKISGDIKIITDRGTVSANVGYADRFEKTYVFYNNMTILSGLLFVLLLIMYFYFRSRETKIQPKTTV